MKVEIKKDIRTKFLSYLKLVGMTPPEFAEEIKRHRCTVYRFINGAKKTEDLYVKHKVTNFINEVEQQLKQELL